MAVNWIVKEVPVKELRFGGGLRSYNEKPDLLVLHRETEHYKKVLAHVREYGIVNPLLVFQGEVCIGNTRLLVAMDLGIETVKCVELHRNDIKVAVRYRNHYQDLNGFIVPRGYPRKRG